MNTTEYGVYYENECPFQTYILQSMATYGRDRHTVISVIAKVTI